MGLNVEFDGFRLLRSMWMLCTLIHVQLLVHGTSQFVLRQHTFDGVLQQTLWVLLKHYASGYLSLAACVASVVSVNHLVHLLASKGNFLTVDDDDVVATVHVRSVARFVLATQDVGNLAAQATQGLTFCIHNVPLALVVIDRTGLVANRLHFGENEIIEKFFLTC